MRKRKKLISDAELKLKLEDIKRTLDTNMTPSQKIQKILEIVKSCYK